MDKFWNSVVEEIVLGIVPTIHKTMEGMEALVRTLQLAHTCEPHSAVAQNMSRCIVDMLHRLTSGRAGHAGDAHQDQGDQSGTHLPASAVHGSGTHQAP